jgi:hypothetical protein
MDESGRQSQELLLAVAQKMGRAICLFFEPGPSKRLLNPLPNDRRVFSPALQPEGQVLFDRASDELIFRMLEHEPGMVNRPRMLNGARMRDEPGRVSDFLIALNLARRGRSDTSQNLNQHGLAGPIGSHDADIFAGMNL